MLPYSIAITIDDNYLQHACVMLKSLEANTQVPLTVYCIFDNLNLKNQALLSGVFANNKVAVIFIEFDNRVLPQLPIKKDDHISSAAFFRIWLPEILKDVKQVVFLDTDIVITEDIGHLLTLPLDNYPIAAVEDLGMGAEKKNALGMKTDAAYFNSGVMVMNLDYFRKHQLTKKVADFISTFPQLCEFWDQDAFNAVVSGEFLHLPLKYNVQSGFYDLTGNAEVQEALNNPHVVHYTGGGNCKPWFYHNNHPRGNLYYQYLKQTPFKYFYPPDLPRSWFIFRKLKFMFLNSLVLCGFAPLYETFFTFAQTY